MCFIVELLLASLILVALIIFFCGSLYFIFESIAQYEDWKVKIKKQDHYTKIKYPFLIQLYSLNNSRWHSFQSDFEMWLPLIYQIDDINYDYIYIYTSYFDYLKLVNNYKRSKRVKKENKDKNNQAESMKILLENSQKDIDNLKKQAQEEINKAAKINKEVKDRLN